MSVLRMLRSNEARRPTPLVLGFARIDMRHVIDVLIGIGFGLLMYGWADLHGGGRDNPRPNELRR